ncbi:Gfo/Idh/MocA family oxidoreductase [Candidatus Poribacteria bacterium]|jgi:predicted dehydrogenase|nr:Gfo/Idh/MocA family oxidoreductase [Candidatus Poribacteria bacterium]MBT5709712.1 Gfo/Idh/MocA family oxidoreductase [Candidatus Poribacteria bacterium]MBT7805830.1 Gfo/Idh/MocA family oxidoreductase [Candidatus Poribacteria bacterium]
MSSYDPLRVAVIGCGGISGPYGASMRTKPEKVEIVGAYDMDAERAEAWAKENGGKAYSSLDDLLAEPAIEAVVNLTIHHAHAEVNRAALAAGKHIHCEKPLATNLPDGRETVRLAEAADLRLSASPFTFLGEAQQTFFKALREERIGTPLVVYSAMNWGRLEVWHGNAAAFYTRGVGPLFDVGVYALTVLTTAFGPVSRVTGFGGIQQPRRTQQSGPREGSSFYVETPDVVISGLEFANGMIGRLTASFLVGGAKDGSGTEVHGESGALYLGSNHDFNCAVEIQSGREWEALPYVAEPHRGVEWGRAVFDLADSLRTGSPQRATGRQALHVLDICVSTLESIEHGHPVSTTTHFEPPPPYYE